MKTIKNKLLQQNYAVEPVEYKDQNKYLRQIAYWVGYFIFEFNNLDDILTNILGLHIGGGDIKIYEHIFLSGMSFNQKIELLDRLYKYETTFINFESSDESPKEKIKKLITELKELGTLRNTIAHANYYSLDKNGNIKAKTKFADSDAEEDWVAITRDFLVESINRISKFTEKIEDFDNQFH